MSLPEIIPSNLPQFVQNKARSNFSNSVIPAGSVLLFAESDGNGGSKLIAKNPDGSFTEVGGGGGTGTFYKCSAVDTANSEWSGNLASVDPVTGVWSFASTATTGLTYGSFPVPEVGKVYAGEECVCQVIDYNTGLPTQGLVFHAKLAGNTTTETGQTLTTVRTVTPTTYEGISCMYLPNTGGCITCPADTLPAGNADITLSGWGNIPDGASINDYWCLMCYGSSSWSNSAFISTKRDWIASFQKSVSGIDNSPGWHHFASTRNSSNKEVKIYIDGQQVGTTMITPDSTINNYNPLVIGDNFNYNNSYWSLAQWHGYVANIRIYNRVLTSGEIYTLATELSPTPAS